MPPKAPAHLREIWKEFKSEIGSIMVRIKRELESRRFKVLSPRTGQNDLQVYTYARVQAKHEVDVFFYSITLSEHGTSGRQHFRLNVADNSGIAWNRVSHLFYQDEWALIEATLREWMRPDAVDEVASEMEELIRGPRSIKDWLPRRKKKR